MMTWMFTIALIGCAFLVYTMIINREFLRCPHCGKVGSWRFDNVEDPVDEVDQDGCLVRSIARQRCRQCGGEVIQVWSDFEGREIRPYSNNAELAETQ